MRTAARSHTDDDVGLAVAIEVRRGDVDATRERIREGREAEDRCSGEPVEDADERAAAGPRRRDDVGSAVTVDVADRHLDRAEILRVVRLDREELLAVGSVEFLHDRPRRRIGEGRTAGAERWWRGCRQVP